MKATLTDLQRASKRVMRRVFAGKTVSLTQHGEMVARIAPDCERVTLSEEEFRSLEITDQAILDAIAESRE